MFSQIFTAFPKSAFNCEHAEKKDERHRLGISEVTNGEKRGYVNV